MFDKMDKNTKYASIGAMAVLALVMFTYYKGRASGSPLIEQAPLPVNKGLSNTDQQFVRELVLKLYDALKGFGNIFRDDTPFIRLATSPDKIFIATYNDFNTLYGKEDNGTLRDWIKDDWYYAGTQTSGAVTTILGRMDALNLK
jgi:hypothetical protein